MRTLRSAVQSQNVVLDGGLGTLLEQHGHDLTSSLWSARMLVDDPAAIRDAHAEYFAAGANVAISSSYQVSFEAMSGLGMGRNETRRVLARSVELARDAARAATGDQDRWVAASVGPYGAMLADGSEYHGKYGLSVAELRDWHRPRLLALAEAAPDALAIETIPSLAEIAGVIDVLDGTGLDAWISVTASMGALRSGESLVDAFALAASIDEVFAVGINCSDPLEVLPAIEAARSVTTKALVVYPNSGEHWDAKNRSWMGSAGFPASLVTEWIAAGANLVGGCCRVGPDEIFDIAQLPPKRNA